MKKFISIISLVIIFASASYAHTPATALHMPRPGALYDYLINICKGMGYSIGQAWHADLKQGDYFTETFKFEEGYTYDIVAFSEDGDVKDVDIEVTTADGEPYAKDTSTADYGEVVITPSFDRSLTIKVKNYRSNTPNYASRTYFFIAYK